MHIYSYICGKICKSEIQKLDRIDRGKEGHSELTRGQVVLLYTEKNITVK